MEDEIAYIHEEIQLDIWVRTPERKTVLTKPFGACLQPNPGII